MEVIKMIKHVVMWEFKDSAAGNKKKLIMRNKS